MTFLSKTRDFLRANYITIIVILLIVFFCHILMEYVFHIPREIAVGLDAIIFAIGFAFWHSVEIDDVLNKMETIETSLSTRYLKDFPDFIPNISQLIQEANHTLTIFCDIPAYGYFSNFSYYKDYEDQITDSQYSDKKEITVELVCLDGTRRQDFYLKEFLQVDKWKDNKEERWKEWKNIHTGKLTRLPKFSSPKYEIETLTIEEFIGILEEANQDMMKEAFAKAECREIENFMPVFFWIADKTKAIFSIPSRSKDGNFTEHGFFTNDKQIINALYSMKNRYLSD